MDIQEIPMQPSIMVPIHVHLTPNQLAKLEVYRRKEQLPRAEVIRQAISEFLARNKS